jgi:hypothetical protein
MTCPLWHYRTARAKEISEAQRKISKAMIAALRGDDGRSKLRVVA